MISENCRVLHVIKEKRKGKKSSTWWCPSQSTKGLTQVEETRVLIPVELRNW
jgi:hypothetical protein